MSRRAVLVLVNISCLMWGGSIGFFNVVDGLLGEEHGKVRVSEGFAAQNV